MSLSSQRGTQSRCVYSKMSLGPYLLCLSLCSLTLAIVPIRPLSASWSCSVPPAFLDPPLELSARFLLPPLCPPPPARTLCPRMLCKRVCVWGGVGHGGEGREVGSQLGRAQHRSRPLVSPCDWRLLSPLDDTSLLAGGPTLPSTLPSASPRGGWGSDEILDGG